MVRFIIMKWTISIVIVLSLYKSHKVVQLKTGPTGLVAPALLYSTHMIQGSQPMGFPNREIHDFSHDFVVRSSISMVLSLDITRFCGRGRPEIVRLERPDDIEIE